MQSFNSGPNSARFDDGANLPRRPELNEGDSIATLWQTHTRLHKPALSILDVRDEKTGFLSRANLLLDQGVERLNKQVAGPKLLVFIDVNHMGPPNKFGLRDEVDQFKRGIGEIFERHLPNAKQRVIGFGGDEFIPILHDTPRDRESLKNIIGEIAELKRTLFPMSDKRVQAAEEYAQLRGEVRKLRSKYLKMSGRNFSSGGFDHWLRGNLSEEQKDASSALSGAALQLHVAEIKLKSRQNAMQRESSSGRSNANRELLSLSFAVVRVGLNPNWESYHRAIGQADFQIHEDKREGRKSSFHPVGISDLISTKSDAIAERDILGRILARQKSIANVLEDDSAMDMAARIMTDQQMARIEHCDPALGDAIRYESAQGEKLGRFLSIADDRRFFRTVIDVDGFGVLNNNHGYVKADGLLRTINEMYRSAAEPYIVIRQGGRLIALTAQKLTKTKLQELEQAMNQEIAPYINDRVLTEHAEREAMNDHEPVRKLRKSLKPMVHIAVDEYGANADSLIREIAQGRPQLPPERAQGGLFAIK